MGTMRKMVCPCCGGKGQVELHEEIPLYLPPTQAQIYRAIRARPMALNAYHLVDILYAHRPDGGPVTALNVVHSLICRMNKKELFKIGEKIVADRRGPGATYRVINVV